MIVYRIAHSLYKDDISGNGAKLKGARWNSKGIGVLYTSEHISLCALEMLVHTGLNFVGNQFFLLHLAVPDDDNIPVIKPQRLKNSWQEDGEYTSFMGDEFIRNKQSLLMKVPSAVVPEENNILINPGHSAFKKVKIIKSAPFIFDKRLTTFK